MPVASRKETDFHGVLRAPRNDLCHYAPVIKDLIRK